MATKKDLVTVYKSGAFGVQKYEGTLLEYGTRKYAQYQKAGFVTFIPKGKRKPIQLLVTYDPYMLILEGVGHPSIDNMETVEYTEHFTITKTAFASFDPRYKTNADSSIDKYLEKTGSKVIADFRASKGFDTF